LQISLLHLFILLQFHRQCTYFRFKLVSGTNSS